VLRQHSSHPGCRRGSNPPRRSKIKLMPKKPHIDPVKKRISEAHLKSVIRAELSKGNTKKTNCYELLRTRYRLTKSTFLKTFDVVHSHWAKLKEKGESEGIVAAVREAAKNGLKSKFDKQLHIQKQIEDIQADIDRGILEDYVLIAGKLQTVNKIMNAESKAYLRKVIKELYAELNKMEGDYAAQKLEVKDVTDLNKLPINFK
jgi:hypothetical protein